MALQCFPVPKVVLSRPSEAQTIFSRVPTLLHSMGALTPLEAWLGPWNGEGRWLFLGACLVPMAARASRVSAE